MIILKAESLISTLIAIVFLSLMCLGYLAWQSQQNAEYQHIFQQQQALHIAENQIARQLAGIACQTTVKQNEIQFEITRCSNEEIEVHFPKGKIIINSKILDKKLK